MVSRECNFSRRVHSKFDTAGPEIEQDPVGFLGTKAFLCPPFLGNYRK